MPLNFQPGPEPDSSSISAGLRAAQVPEPTPAPESQETVTPVEAEQAGDTPPETVETAPAAEPEGEQAAEPTNPAGDPPGEAPVSDDEVYAVALRLAGNDPNKIPGKLKEVSDKYSKTNNELLAARKELEELKKAQQVPPVQPQAPATTQPTAPVTAAAPVISAPDPKAIEEQALGLLNQDAEYTRAAQSHWYNLMTLVNIYGGTDDKGQKVVGRLAEVEGEITALGYYSPDSFNKYGIKLDEFALAQVASPEIKNRLIELRAERSILKADASTARNENVGHYNTILRRKADAERFVTSRLTSASRETEEKASQDAEANDLAGTYNRKFDELAPKLGITDADDREVASLRAQAHFRKNPDDMFDGAKMHAVIEGELKKVATKLDERKRSAARAVAVRKDEITKPMAPAGQAAVASKPSSTNSDPFSALKQADQARYKGAGV